MQTTMTTGTAAIESVAMNLSDPQVQAAIDLFRAELLAWPPGDPKPTLFWRDDDLTRDHPNLERLLEISDRRAIPVVLAAVPRGLKQQAADKVRASRHARIALHGYAHLNHSGVDAPRSEYPVGRDPAEVLRELNEGIAIVRQRAGRRFLNMFAPPWGKFDPSLDSLLTEAGIVSFSGGSGSGTHTVAVQHDCQVATEHKNRMLGLNEVLTRVTRELKHRRVGHLPRSSWIGLLTHHRTLSEEMLEVLDALLGLMRAEGLVFSDFASIDALSRSSSRVADGSGGHSPAIAGLPAPTQERLGVNHVESLLDQTIPVEPGHEVLRQTLLELGKTSPIALLRYAHMRDMVETLPAGTRVLSAGCGRGLAELALALARPELSWVAFDVDARRFTHAQKLAHSAKADNIEFAVADLNDPKTLTFNQVGAILMSEVAVYLADPRRSIEALCEHLSTDGTFTWVEPFLPREDAGALQKLKAHTQSLHGGFTHEQMSALVGNMKVEAQGNCYFSVSTRALKQLWQHMADTGRWDLLDFAFGLARADLTLVTARSRSVATAIKVIARPRR